MTYFLVLATSAIVALGAASAVRRLALQLGAVVATRPDRWHRRPTPTYGGIGVLVGLLISLLFHLPTVIPAIPALAAGVALFGIGWYDDVRPLGAVAKLVNSLAVASFFVFSLSLFGTAIPATVSLVLIIWFAGVVNAVNLLDNMDGLAAGTSAIAALGLAAAFHQELGPSLTLVLVGLAGSLGGFLVLNVAPARLFMGNCGSLAIGGLLAGCAATAVVRAWTIGAALAAILILIVPLFDTLFVVLLRRLAGRPTTRGDVDHTSHRLVMSGFSERRAVGILYGLGIAGAGAGFLLQSRGAGTWPIAATLTVGAALLALYLARVPAYSGEDFRSLQDGAIAPILSDLTFRWHAGEVLLDVVLIAICYYTSYRLRFEGDALSTFLATFSASFPIILGCKLAALYTSGLYSRMWSTFGLPDLATVLRGVFLGSMLSVLAATWLYKFERFSRGVFVIDAVLLTGAIVATRLSFRILTRVAMRSGGKRRRVLVYGAGSRGQMLVRELLANPAWKLDPVAFVDDDLAKVARRFLGVPVRGSATDLERVLARHPVDEVLLSSPAINGAAEAQVREVCLVHEIVVRRLYLDLR